MGFSLHLHECLCHGSKRPRRLLTDGRSKSASDENVNGSLTHHRETQFLGQTDRDAETARKVPR